MCNCIAEMNEKLAAFNSRLSLGFVLARTNEGEQSLTDAITIETVKIDKKKRVGPAAAIATFCPFCGVKYERE